MVDDNASPLGAYIEPSRHTPGAGPALRRVAAADTPGAVELDRHRLALDLVGFGVVWVAESGELLHLNAAAIRLLATGAGDARQRGVTWDSFRPTFADGAAATIAELLGGDAVQRRQVDLVDTTGTRQTVLLESHPPVAQRHTGQRELLLLLRPPRGDAAHDPPGTDDVVAHLRPVPPARPDLVQQHDMLRGVDLSAREREIVDLLLHGYRVTSIAPRLYLSTHTIRNHLKSVFRKAGVTSQAELIELARRRRAG